VLLALVISAGGLGPQADFHSPSAVAASLRTLIQKRLSDPAGQY
jgi:molybdopterin-biosynthesis enzyme MoeA-like protein